MDDDGRQKALKMLEIAALRIIKMDDRDQEVIGLLRIASAYSAIVFPQKSAVPCLPSPDLHRLRARIADLGEINSGPARAVIAPWIRSSDPFA